MGTKNNPGAFDCYANAKPDEPIFVLLGRDHHAAALVRLWALARQSDGEDEAKVAEAFNCADQMDAWARSLGKDPIRSMLSAARMLCAAMKQSSPINKTD